jgi:hypothetical protein
MGKTIFTYYIMGAFIRFSIFEVHSKSSIICIKVIVFFLKEKNVNFIKRNKNYIMNNARRNHAFSLKNF